MTQGIDVTVAAIIERDSQFLLVEELVGGQVVLNQPAGHLEAGESLLDAVVRETLEETGHHFEPSHLVGVYLWQGERTSTTLLRVAFCGGARAPAKPARLDDGILGFHWLGVSEARRRERHLRSPMVLRGMDDYLAGIRYPLDCLTHLVPALDQAALARA
jgi:8-oxo-dGTP pyrophosphatase MutT (NUDIX family)